MRLAIIASVFFAACAPASRPVPSHPAVARYSMNVDAARAAVHDVLADRWLRVDEVGTDAFSTNIACRTDAGDDCPKRNTIWNANDAKTDGDTTYGFQVMARVVPADTGAIVQISARVEERGQTQFVEVGKGEVPAWAQHEIDGLQAAISHKLASPRATAL